MMEGMLRYRSFWMAHVENITFSIRKIPHHHAEDESSVRQSTMIKEKLPHSI